MSDNCRVRHTHVQVKGRVICFSVQLELLTHGKWQAVRRYDTAHGFSHCDILHPDGSTEKVPVAFHEHNEALTFAETDLRTHWSLYVRRYIEEARGHD